MEATLSSWCTPWFDRWVLISNFWLRIPNLVGQICCLPDLGWYMVSDFKHFQVLWIFVVVCWWSQLRCRDSWMVCSSARSLYFYYNSSWRSRLSLVQLDWRRSMIFATRIQGLKDMSATGLACHSCSAFELRFFYSLRRPVFLGKRQEHLDSSHWSLSSISTTITTADMDFRSIPSLN